MKGKVFGSFLLVAVLSLAVTSVAFAQGEGPGDRPGAPDGDGLVVRSFPLGAPLQDHDQEQNGWMNGRNPANITGREGYPLPYSSDGSDHHSLFLSGQEGENFHPRRGGRVGQTAVDSFSEVSGLNLSDIGGPEDFLLWQANVSGLNLSDIGGPDDFLAWQRGFGLR